MNDSVVLACEGLVKEFRQGPAIVRVLAGVNTSIRRGERVAVVGASGSGKTTLLQLLGGLDLPTAGRVLIDGREMSALPDAERGRLRNAAMGFVYQFHHLLPEFSALENVAMPLLIRRLPRAQASQQARDLLVRVGLGERLTHRPSQLSGGEQQRAAIARALVLDPPLLLADEPTGNLDSTNGANVLELLRGIHAEGRTILMVTHDPEIAKRADRTIHVRDGRVVV